MARIRYNNQAGTLGASLTSGGTTITFASAPNFATLSGGDYIALALDPGTASFEIVYLTAYTAGATTGTITRAAEDATHWPAVAHASGAAWDNSALVADMALAEDADVAISSPADAQVLTYHAATSKWINAAASGGSHAAVVHMATAVSIPNSTDVLLKFDTKDSDPDVAYSVSTGLYTCPVAGVYLVAGQVGFPVFQGSTTTNSIWKNGALIARPFWSNNGGGNTRIMAFSMALACAAGDTLGVGIWTSTGPQNTEVGSNCQASFIKVA